MCRNVFKICLISTALLMAACSSTPENEGGDLDVKDNTPTKDIGSTDKKDTVDTTSDTTGTVVGTSEWGDDANAWGTGYSIDYLRSLGIDRNPLDYDTVYFPYNSTAVDERGKIIIEAHSRNLQTYATTNVVLEGHADERGTREYNLALGEKRAIAVQDLMNATGTGSSTLQPIRRCMES